MTIEEAITVLNCVDAYGIANEAKKMAIKALEREISHTPKFDDVGNVYGAVKRTCTVCGDTVMISPAAMNFEYYCRKCGVKLREEGAEE